jgi:hypothetical protein
VRFCFNFSIGDRRQDVDEESLEGHFHESAPSGTKASIPIEPVSCAGWK